MPETKPYNKKEPFPKQGDNFKNARKFTKDDERWFKDFGQAMEAFRQRQGKLG